MAELKIFNNIFEKDFMSFKFDDSFSIRNEIGKYANNEAYLNMMVECYDDETGETFFAPLTDDNNSDSVLILVNGKSVSLDYVPKNNDLVVVMFLPTDGSRSAYQWGGGLIGGFLGAMTGIFAGALMGFAAGGLPGAIIGIVSGLIIGGVVGAIGGVNAGEQIYDNNHRSKISGYNTGKDGEKLPDVRGAENQALTGNSFPFVIGKHLVTPFIVGNPYTTYEGENGEDAIIREILVVGYAPLKLTDFKLGDTWLAYNRSVGHTSRFPVMSGTLSSKTKTQNYKIAFGIAGWNDTIGELLSGLFPTANIDTFSEKTFTAKIMVSGTTYRSISIRKSDVNKTFSVKLSGGENSREFNGTLDSKIPFGIEVYPSTFNNTDYDNDILDYWSNNNVELEILQQCPDSKLRDSKIYPSKVVDTDVNANLLFVIDGDIKEVAKKKNIIYKNVGFINGLRTNTVRFTESCPIEFTVTLDMPAGLYSQWSWDGATKYGSIPTWMALQWRFYSENNKSSDESGGDYDSWHNFIPDGTDDYASYSSNFKGEYATYNSDRFEDDLKKHEGNSLTGDTDINSLFKVLATTEAIEVIKKIETIPQDSVFFDIKTRATYKPDIGTNGYSKTPENELIISWKSENGTPSSFSYKMYNKADYWGLGEETITHKLEKVTVNTQNGVFYCVDDTVTNADYDTKHTYHEIYIFADKDFSIENSECKCRIDGVSHYYQNGKSGHYYETRYITNFSITREFTKTLSYISNNWFDQKLLNFEPYSGEDGISEKRATFTCKLNLNSCKQIINDSSNKVKGIEVRAIRVSPNYLNMTSSWGEDNKGSPKQYSDAIQWKSLITKTFSEDRLKDLMDKQEAGKKDDGNTVTDAYIINEIPEKILSEEDMRKLCVIAIKAKADVNGTIQQQMKKINCIAESFSPFYSEEAKRWIPDRIHKDSGYYKPIQDSTGQASVWEEVTKEQYEEARGNGLSWKEEAKGSNYAKIMLRMLMRSWDVNGRYVLPDLYTIFNKKNAASGLMLGIVGSQNGAAAFGYEDLNMLSFTDGYTFCEAVEDGTTYSATTIDESGEHKKDEPVIIKYEASAYIYQQQKMEDLLKKLAICSRAVLTYDNYGRLRLVVDKQDDYPKGVINQQNCISGTNSYSWAELPAGLRFSFSDENDGYEQNSVYCWADNNSLKSYKGPVQNYTIDYITNPRQLWSMGRYVLACILLQREILTRKVGSEGDIFSIGDTVLVQDNSLLLGDGSARIQDVIEDSDYIYGFIVDTPFSYRGELDNGKCKQGVTVLQPKQMGQSRTVTLRLAVDRSQVIGGNFTYTMAKGITNICLFDEKVKKTNSADPSDSISLKFNFSTGDIVMFGDYTLISQKYRITKIKPEQDGSFTETLVPYFDELYKYGAPMPSFQSPVKMPSVAKEAFSLGEVPNNIADNQKNITYIVDNIKNNIDSTPPSAPVLADISADDNGNITLVWNGSTDDRSGVAEYCIYHKTDGRFVRIQTIPHDENSQAQYTFTHITSEKFTTHYYYVTAKDKMNNESEPSDTLPVENPVKTKPYEPKALKAMAMRDYIRLEWTCEQSTNASLNPRLFKVEIKRNDTDEWESVGEYSSRETLYYFDRSKDGYSEADKISKYQFRVKSVSVYELESEYCTSESVNVDNYLGWKIGDIEISSYATEGTLFIKASVKGSSYGDKFLNVKYGDEIVAENSLAGRMFYVKLNGYQEVSDITSKDISVECYSVADNVSKTLAGSNIDTSLYKTYKITKPSVTAYADKQGIHISWSDNTSDYYLKPTYKLTINGKEVLSAEDTLDYNWLFAENSYPTKAEVLAHTISLAVSTDADSVEISDIAIDISVFKGWIPDVPDIKLSVSGRTVPVSWNIQSDNVYDFLGCELQVAKGYKVTAGKYSVITDESELEWFAPALGLNPYESLENYKKGDKDGYLSIKGSSVAFSVPLFGQDNDGAMNTMYVYRARAFTKGGKSEWSDAYFVEVKPVSAYDVVKAWDINDSGEKVKIDGALGAKQIFVEELAAISANLGYITDGALQGNQYNYWAVNDTVLSDGSVLYKGAFRVGGVDKYIKVIPQVKNGVVTDYDVELHVGDFSMTATGTLIEGGYFTVKDSTGNILFQLTPEKASVQVNEGTYNSAGLVDIYATPFYGENSNVNGTAFSDSLLCPYRYDFYNAKLYLIDIIYNSSSSSTLEIYEVSGRETTRKRRLEAISAFCWIKDGYVYYFSTTTVLFTKKNCIKKTKISTGITTNYTNIDDAINLKTAFVLGDYMVLYDDSDSNNTKLYLYNLTSSTKSEGFNIGKQSIIGFTEENDYLYIAISLSLGTSILRISKTSFAWEVTTCLFALDLDKMKVENEGIICLLSFLFVKNNVISIQGAVTYFVTDSSTAKQEALVLVENPDFEIATDLNNLSKISSITVYGNDLKEDSLNKIRVKSNTGDYLFNIDDYYLYSLKRNDAEEPVECYNAVWKGSISYEKIQVLKEGEVYNGNNGMIVIPQVCFEYKDEQENNNALLICGYDIRVDADARYFQWTSVVGMYKTEQYNKKSKAVYETGIGFTGIYFNSLNDTYRYVTDTGAYLEFDSNGRLVSTKGDTGATGPQGPQGQSAGFGDITASVDDNTGIPEVTVTTKGFDSKKYIDFAFKNLKGKQGEPGVSVVKVEQIETSTKNGGTNKIRITLSNGSTSDFVVKNGNSSTIDADHFKGTLPVSKGGTGATDAATAFNTLANAARNSSTPADTEKMLLKPAGTWYKTTCLDFWNYIKGKISSVLGLTASSYSGTAAYTSALCKRGQINKTDTFQTIMNNEGTWNIGDLNSTWTGMLVTFHQPGSQSGSQSGLMFRIKGGSADIRNVEVNYSIDSNRFAGPWYPLIGRIPTSAPSSPQNGDIWIE